MRKSLTQEVKEFFDEEGLIEQTFLIDDDRNNDFEGEPWVVVENGIQELSLSLNNWKKLIEENSDPDEWFDK